MSDVSKDESDLNYTNTACGLCKQIVQEPDGMVQCDACDDWFHYKCVGVTNAVKLLKMWYCPLAECQKAAIEYQRKLEDALAAGTIASAEDRMKAMEIEQQREESDWEAEKLVREKRMVMQAALKKKKMKEEQELLQKERQLDGELAEESRQLELENKDRAKRDELRIKQEHAKRLQAMEDKYQEQMAILDQKLAELKAIDEEREKAAEKVVVSDDPPQGTSGTNKPPGAHSTPIAKGQCKKVDTKDVIDPEDSSEGSSETGDSDDDEPVDRHGQEERADGEDAGAPGRPTRAQMAARHGIVRHLPQFSGKPEDWPLFYASYTSSTEACGYSNIDNLARLQHCLKGNALELVRGQLLLPESVPRVLEKLRRNFGRPEQLLQSHLERVRKLEQPKNLRGFIPFANVVEQLCEHLEAAGLKQHLKNPLLVEALVKKLPDLEKRQWADLKRKRGNKAATLRTITDFICQIAEDACEANVDVDFGPEPKSSSGPAPKKGKEKGAVFSHSEVDSTKEASGSQRKLKPCKVCRRTDHRLRYCQDFKNLPLTDRIALVTREKLCKLCLGDHPAPCRFKFRCDTGECKEAHNALIHPAEAVGHVAHIHSRDPMMFRMIPLQLHCGERSMTVLAFLDEGASVTLVESYVADHLGIVGRDERLAIRWTADITRVENGSRRMNIWASAVGDGEKLLLQTVRTVGKLMMPRQRLDAEELQRQHQYMSGLPISSYDGRPAILIGLNNIHTFAPIEVRMGSFYEPIAVRCRLGWTVYGPRRTIDNAPPEEFVSVHQDVSNEDIHDLLRSHYALEESVVASTPETAEVQRSRAIMERTTKRVGERFEIGLLWRIDDVRFPDSRPMALRRLIQLEKKLRNDPELYQNVRNQIVDYLRKGYAHLATEEELAGTDPWKVWYLPINAVLNPNKPGKVRLVWDAAASVNGVSLNSQLLKGPDLLVPLIAVICGFRERRVAFGADIAEMFHQLRIIQEDRQAQRFLFRDRPELPPQVYVMDVATFGATCSPSSAQFIKNRNAEEHASRYPEAAAAIINRHYVDDYFDSVDTIEEAAERAKQVRSIHKNGGFVIRNWVSNSSEVLQQLGETGPAKTVLFNCDKETSNERVLGIRWDPIQDEFSFTTAQRPKAEPFLHGGMRPTKRAAMSCVMGFFDPLGLLSPFTIHGKVILQHLWRKGCDWEENIDDEGWRLWKRWTGLLPEVESVRIPRCFIGSALSTDVESLELHVFTDASEHAYGCVAYLRAVIGGQVRCSLVMSRAKVAPLKRQSIPRLELMAALLGARMVPTILKMLTLRVTRCVYWTDSRTVLSWLGSDQYKYKQFVAFRVGEILELTRVFDWRWIPTKQNIADVLTKWGCGPPLQSDSEWFRGPSFLLQPEEFWPSQQIQEEETNEDERGIVLFHDIQEIGSISSWERLLRVTATGLRFIENCRRKRQGLPIRTAVATKKQLPMLKANYNAEQTSLEQDELDKAEKILWKQSQQDSFPAEIDILTKNLQRTTGLEKIGKRSVVFKYSPMLDDDGVMRVDGRLANAEQLPFDQKYPVILDRSHDVTKKIIQSYHEDFGHGNGETVFNEMRKKFEIPSLRAAIARVAAECVWCRVHRCRPQAPRMAALPPQRVTPGKRPFSAVGIDYLGPVEVTVGRHKEKRWVAVFTCLAVRAVHLEVVHSLSTQSCRMAISRFTSKHGKPEKIFSDNGTCFRGAWNEMTKQKNQINKECAEQIVSPSTSWHFNPPATPHMGGIWERMVRSVKAAMKVLGDGMKLTDEILATTVAEAADMINSRPLTYKPQDPACEAALTPNDFLRGAVAEADALTDAVGPAEALRDTYKRSQYLSDRMWERWTAEYLPSINRRNKWFDQSRPLSVGDLVFVVDGSDRKNWKRAKVVEVFPGADGVVRQVNVMTADRKVHRRGAINLAVLEVQERKPGSP